MDKGKSDHQGALGIFGECCKDPSLGRDQLLSHSRVDESSFKDPFDHHGGIEGCRGINSIQG